MICCCYGNAYSTGFTYSKNDDTSEHNSLVIKLAAAAVGKVASSSHCNGARRDDTMHKEPFGILDSEMCCPTCRATLPSMRNHLMPPSAAYCATLVMASSVQCLQQIVKGNASYMFKPKLKSYTYVLVHVFNQCTGNTILHSYIKLNHIF